LELPEFSVAACVPVREVVRLEAMAESLGVAGVAGEDFPAAFRAALTEAPAVAWKTIAAYRYGLDLDPGRPTDAEVAEAAGRWLPTGSRLTDPVVLRFLLWSAVDTGRPIQVHCGLGDPDETLRQADPAFLQPFLHQIRTPVVLLHCYPYHRQAAYLAHAYPHVYLDVVLALNHVGAAASTVLGEVLELAPFHKVLYSSDAYGLPELYFLGATLFRRALTDVLDRWIVRDDLLLADAKKIAADIAAGTARALYRL
jgi:predicted TIM-barrel fold metal-dependent hydrolase